jgi:hypothetical protein
MTSTDTKEEVCVSIDKSLQVVECSGLIDIEAVASKDVFVALIGTYSDYYFYAKSAYYIRNNQLEVTPNKINFLKGESVDIKYFANVYQWTNPSEHSQGNLLIGKFLWELDFIEKN